MTIINIHNSNLKTIFFSKTILTL